MKTTFDITQLVRPHLKELKPYSSARDEYKGQGSGMVFLDANENPFETQTNRYPDPKQRNLKELLIAQRPGLQQEQLLIGNGSDEVLDLLVRAFCAPGKDAMITLPPTYGMYKVLAGINDIENIEVPLDTNFQPNVAAILDSVSARTKILFLCSPNNPTGNSITASAIEAIIEQFPGLVVIDEAYIDFSDAPSWTTRLNDFPNLVVTQTLSKAYGMAGIRVGLCFASPEIINILNTIKPPYNVNELSQQYAMERLSQPEIIQEEVAMIKEQRTWLQQQLQEIPFVSELLPTKANFILIRVDNADLRYQQMISEGIVLRNRSTQFGCENTLRITVGTPEENQQLINVFNKIVI